LWRHVVGKGHVLENRLQGKPWAYFGIGETVDLAHTGTQAMLRLFIQQASKLVCWIATPASTQLRHVGLHNSESRDRWKSQIQMHGKLWSSLGKVFGEFPQGKCLVLQEWPIGNSLWHEGTYLRIAKKIGLEQALRIKRCCLDGIHKELISAANQHDFSKLSASLILDSVRPVRTAFYSLKVVKFLCPELLAEKFQDWSAEICFIDRSGTCFSNEGFNSHGVRRFQ